MRMYVTPEQWNRTALGRFWTNRARGLYAADAQQIVADALMSASAEADDYVRRFLGAPGVTTVAAGSTSNQLSVNSTVGFDVGDPWGIIVANATYQILDVTILNFNYPLQGYLTVSPNLVGSYPVGTPVQGVYKERTNVTGVSTNFSDQNGVLTQEAQSAEAHAPREMLNSLVRQAYISSPPLTQLLSVGTVLRWGSYLNPLPLSNIAVNIDQGVFRFPIGIFVPPGSDIEVFYIGGYRSLPRSMADAVSALAADNMATGLAPFALGYASSEVGSARAAVTVKMRRGREIEGEVSLLRSRALQLLEPHIRMTP